MPSFRAKFTGLLKYFGPKADTGAVIDADVDRTLSSTGDTNNWVCGSGSPAGSFTPSDYGGSINADVPTLNNTLPGSTTSRQTIVSFDRQDGFVGTVGGDLFYEVLHGLNLATCQYFYPITDDSIIGLGDKMGSFTRITLESKPSNATADEVIHNADGFYYLKPTQYGLYTFKADYHYSTGRNDNPFTADGSITMKLNLTNFYYKVFNATNDMQVTNEITPDPQRDNTLNLELNSNEEKTLDLKKFITSQFDRSNPVAQEKFMGDVDYLNTYLNPKMGQFYSESYASIEYIANSPHPEAVYIANQKVSNNGHNQNAFTPQGFPESPEAANDFLLTPGNREQINSPNHEAMIRIKAKGSGKFKLTIKAGGADPTGKRLFDKEIIVDVKSMVLKTNDAGGTKL